MTGVFISYRREDSAGYAGRLFDRARLHFGPDAVFMDVAAIAPGLDFGLEIDKAIAACDTVLVVIGRHWFGATGDDRRRLDDPEDFVRLEVAAAIRRGARVVPVLVGGAPIPDPALLPDELKPLIRRQAVTLSDEHWDSNVADLLRSLDGSDADDGHASPVERRRRPFWRRGVAPWLLAGMLMLVAVGGFEAWHTWWPGLVVPDLAGQDVTQATALLRAARLEPGAVQQRSVPATARDGVVLEQTPAAGTRVRQGSRVGFVLAQRQRPSVPTLVGLPLAAAGAAAREAGLTLERTGSVVDAKAAPDTVLSQTPPPGQTVEPGTSVGVVVAAAPAALQFVPATLDFGRRRPHTSSVESVAIVNPGGEAMSLREVLAGGGDGAFAVAAGACAGNTLVAGERCSVDVYFVPRGEGRHEAVLTVLDAAGRAHTGPPLVGEGSGDDARGAVEVPRLARLSYDQAFFALGQAGLTVGAVTLRISTSVPSGTVLQQLTAAGSRVPPRTAVDFVVAVRAINVAAHTRSPGERPAVGGGTRPGLEPPAAPVPAAVPAILHFGYDAVGQRLCWGVTGAVTANIEPTVGNVAAAAQGCVPVKADVGTRRYTLVASGARGDSVRRSLELPR